MSASKVRLPLFFTVIAAFALSQIQVFAQSAEPRKVDIGIDVTNPLVQCHDLSFERSKDSICSWVAVIRLVVSGKDFGDQVDYLSFDILLPENVQVADLIPVTGYTGGNTALLGGKWRDLESIAVSTSQDGIDFAFISTADRPLDEKLPEKMKRLPKLLSGIRVPDSKTVRSAWVNDEHNRSVLFSLQPQDNQKLQGHYDFVLLLSVPRSLKTFSANCKAKAKGGSPDLQEIFELDRSLAFFAASNVAAKAKARRVIAPFTITRSGIDTNDINTEVSDGWNKFAGNYRYDKWLGNVSANLDLKNDGSFEGSIDYPFASENINGVWSAIDNRLIVTQLSDCKKVELINDDIISFDSTSGLLRTNRWTLEPKK